MAHLIKCPVCGNDVSSEAVACQNCGHGVAADIDRAQFEKTAKTRKVVGTISIVSAVIISLIFIITAATYRSYNGDGFGYFVYLYSFPALMLLVSLLLAISAGITAMVGKTKKSIRTAGILFAIAGVLGALTMLGYLPIIMGVLCLINIAYSVVVFRSIKERI